MRIRSSHAVILVARRLKTETNDRQSIALMCRFEDRATREMRTEVSAVLECETRLAQELALKSRLEAYSYM